MSNSYKLRYLPLFERDITAVKDYITNVLLNPVSAQRLIDEVDEAIVNRSSDPLVFEPYRSTKSREHPYYPIRVRNYTVFYVVIGDTMEVRRFLYSKRNIAELI